MRARLPAALAFSLVALAATLAAAQTGLPQRAPEPRTMREFWPVFLALSLLWLAVVAAALRLTGPYGRIARRIQRLERPSPPA